MYEPVVAGQIVNACAVLHNMRLHYRMPQEDLPPPEQEPAEPEAPAEHHPGGRLAEGRRVRDQIIRDHFR